LPVVRHAFSAWGSEYRNVVATVGGSSAPPLIVAAHYDTVQGSPGADDNASGLAVLLDVARTLAAESLSRPVQFIAFCLEEEDLLGSRAYIAHLRATQREILGAIVLECVGYAGHEEGSQRTPPGIPIAVPSVGDFLAIVGNQGSAHLAAEVERAANQQAPALKTLSLLMPGRGERLPDTRRSDHAAFWDADYPAVMLTDTADYRNPHYHRPTDTFDTLNVDFMTQVAAAVTAAVHSLAGPPSSG
jgi:Zn-dependent M28 family amino/carboxypeptidase